MERLEISTAQNERITVITATGEIDTSTARSFADALLGHPVEDVVVSLEGISYIDSSGLTVLVRTHKERSAAGFHLYVVLPRPPADRVFEITSLSGLFPCFRRLDEAMDAAEAERAPRGAA